MKPHKTWRDGCWKCEDAYPFPHQPNDEAERHYDRMEALDRENPLWDMPRLEYRPASVPSPASEGRIHD